MLQLNASQIVSLFLSGPAELEKQLAFVSRLNAKSAAALLRKRLTSTSERVKVPEESQVLALEAWVEAHFAATAAKRGAASKPFAEGEERKYKIQRHKKSGKPYVIIPLDAVAGTATHVCVQRLGESMTAKPC